MSKKNMSEVTGSKDKLPADGMQGHDISKDETEEAAERRTRRLRRINIVMLRASAAILMLLCVMLLVRVQGLNRTITSLKGRVDQMSETVLEQRRKLDQMSEELGKVQDGGQAEHGAVEANSQGTAGRPGSDAAHKVYLTFDDGPSENTEDILAILDKYDVKATFFVVGLEDDEAMRAIVDAGHTLGMHSCTHDYDELYASTESFAADFARQQEHIYQATGVKSTVYRFPGGSSNSVSDTDMKEFADYLDRQGVRFFDWNVSSGDGGGFVVPVETLLENCTKKIQRQGTSVVLMHDRAGKDTTVEALPRIIEKIQAMDDTALLPITEETELVQHIQWRDDPEEP